MTTKSTELQESHLRSILKGLSWRVIASLVTIACAYLVTGKVQIALEIGGIEVVSKIFIYYIHERAWQLVPRGTIRKVYKHEQGR